MIRAFNALIKKEKKSVWDNIIFTPQQKELFLISKKRKKPFYQETLSLIKKQKIKRLSLSHFSFCFFTANPLSTVSLYLASIRGCFHGVRLGVCAVTILPANETHRKHKDFQNPIYIKRTSVKPTLLKINPSSHLFFLSCYFALSHSLKKHRERERESVMGVRLRLRLSFV